jgi:predicted nucleic acid-binding protein
MIEIFADTSGWAEYFIETCPKHRSAEQIIKRCRASSRRSRMVTTNYILMEFAALLISPLRVHHAKRIEILDVIRNAPWVEIVHITPDLDELSWQLLNSRSDKDWSLVDCSSFVLMDALKIRDALTTDHHFVQAGFGMLLA